MIHKACFYAESSEPSLASSGVALKFSIVNSKSLERIKHFDPTIDARRSSQQLFHPSDFSFVHIPIGMA